MRCASCAAFSVGKRSLPLAEVVVPVVEAPIPALVVVVVVAVAPGGVGTVVIALNILFALAPKETDDPERDDDADGDRCLVVSGVGFGDALVVLHVAAPGGGGVLKVLPVRVAPGGD